MRVQVVESYQALSRRAAREVEDVVRSDRSAVLGLPTGSTPRGLYALLGRSSMSFADVTTFDLDEYVALDPDAPRSYRHWLQEHLLGHIDMLPENAHFLDGKAADLDSECRRYEASILAAGGLDLVILGLGPNGHIGFNEPGTPWDAPTHVVELTPATRRANARFFGSQDAVPRRALTMGVGTILAGRRILLLASGRRKASVVRRLLRGPASESLPASALLAHPDAMFLLDRAAADQASL